jgi:hypothetical protein
MSTRLSNNVVIDDNPHVQPDDTSSAGANEPALASIVTGTSVSFSQTVSVRVPSFVTRETFENTDCGRDVTYVDGVDELLDSLES